MLVYSFWLRILRFIFFILSKSQETMDIMDDKVKEMCYENSRLHKEIEFLTVENANMRRRICLLYTSPSPRD